MILFSIIIVAVVAAAILTEAIAPTHNRRRRWA